MKVTFEDQSCHIFYATRQNIQQAKMRGKIFSFLQSKKEHTTFSTKINNTKYGTNNWDTVIFNTCTI